MHIHATANIIAALADTLMADRALTPDTLWQGGIKTPDATWAYAIQAKADLRVIDRDPQPLTRTFVGSSQDIADLEDLFADR